VAKAPVANEASFLFATIYQNSFAVPSDLASTVFAQADDCGRRRVDCLCTSRGCGDGKEKPKKSPSAKRP